MKHLKHFLLMAAMLLCSVGASAETVEIDGIWYNLISKVKQAEVARSGGTNYSGSITIPSSVTYEGVEYSVTSIGDYAFFRCSSLTAISLPEGVTSIGDYAFYGCSLTTITIPESVTSIGNSAFSNCTSLTAINIPEGVTSIGDYAFSACSSLTPITIPESVTSIGDYAFQYCRSLTAINIPEGVTSIGDYAFYKCSNLTDIHIASIESWLAIDYGNSYSHPNVAASNVELYIGGEEVTEVVVPSSIESIPYYAFYNCSNLTSITLPESVTSIGSYAFYDCSSLTSITLPENSQLTSIGDYAFFDCSSLTSITLPESVTSIGWNAFFNCRSLTSITLPESVTSIGWNAFENCSNLSSITIPESVTSIGKRAFYGCTSLTSIVLPKSVKSIGSEAFANCSELTDVYCNAETVPSTNTDAFEGSYIEYATLHVPDNAVASYKTTAPWSSFGTIVSLDAALTRITLGASSATLTEGESLTLTLTTTPEDADRNLISWSSSNPSIATVDNAGKVTAIAPGTAIITATANDGSGVSASCEVTVVKRATLVTNIILSQSSAALAEGESLTLTAAVSPDDAEDKSVSWSSSASNVATVDNAGKVTAIAPGTAIITATANDGSGVSASCEVTVTPASYIITFLVDGEVYATETLSRGATISVPDAPTKEGHTFSGWSGLPETMPAKDITVSATFTVNKYQVTFKIDGVVIATYTQDYGSAIVAPEAPEREGYTFSGWGNVAETVPASDVTYEGSYTANLYNVYYFVGATLVHSVKVAYGEPIPEYIYEPEEEGYTFLGWIGETYASMPAHDVTYTANIDNGIGTLTIDCSQLNIYDLTGRKVTDTENLKGGIYIINGKKVVIK